MNIANDRILSEIDVLKITTFSRSLLRVEIEAGRFPRSLLIAAKRRGWRASDIDGWVAGLKEVDTGSAEAGDEPDAGKGE